MIRDKINRSQKGITPQLAINKYLQVNKDIKLFIIKII